MFELSSIQARPVACQWDHTSNFVTRLLMPVSSTVTTNKPVTVHLHVLHIRSQSQLRKSPAANVLRTASTKVATMFSGVVCQQVSSPACCTAGLHTRLQTSPSPTKKTSARHHSRNFVQQHSRCRMCLNATQSSQQDSPQTAQELQTALQDAVKLEQYAKAAELRDRLRSLAPQDTALALKKRLDYHVIQEEFEVLSCVAVLREVGKLLFGVNA